MGSPIENVIRSSIAKGVEAIGAFNRKRQPRRESPFLSGIHEPMDREFDLSLLPVTGTIPAGLDGRYLRIGPNPVAPDSAGYHWFIGDGMVHGLRIADGKALWYRNRWIRSNAVAEALGEAPAPGPRHSFDTVNTNIVGMGGRTFALVEAGSYPVELSDDLEGQCYNNFDGTLKGSFTAHPHRDPLTGEQHAIAYEGRDQSVIRHIVIDPSGKVVREEPVAVAHGPMIHDCAITDRFVVILDLPVTFSMKAIIAGHGFPYRWNPDHPARVGLMPRHGTQEEIIWCAVEPGYAFHVANAYDRADGKVELDLCVYETMFADDAQGPDARSRGLERWTVDPDTKTVAIRTIDASPQEFPRIDDRHLGQPYRYAFAMALPDDPAPGLIGATVLYRHDLLTGERQGHDFGEGRVPGEFVFVPKTPDSAEGEGWLIGLVIDIAADRTDLAIIDTTRFADAPVASIHLPHRVPAGFHGNWIGSLKN